MISTFSFLGIVFFIFQVLFIIYIIVRLLNLKTMIYDGGPEEYEKILKKQYKNYRMQHNFSFFLLWSTVIISCGTGCFMSFMIFLKHPAEDVLIKSALLIL
jgi:hypothetical protein